MITKPSVRNSTVYEIRILKKVQTNENEKKEEGRLLLTMRCSILLLPDSLNTLAKEMCPELGGKGEMDHNSITLESLENPSDVKRYRSYLTQDVILLARIMQLTQDFFWENFMIDIVTKLTIAALAFAIFRMDYYDDEKHRMYIPNQNADKFIRRGYFGGHSDVYKPVGENVYVYDVNSLYPSVMVGNKFPGGKPVWHSDLSKRKLDELFGFIEALVISPSTHKPFLPTRHPEEKSLYFPEGTIFGVHYTEELKYAETLGYKVIPCCGYLFEPMDSPFDSYVTDIYARSQKPKHPVRQYMPICLRSLHMRKRMLQRDRVAKK